MVCPPHTANARKLPRPVTSLTTPSACNVRSNAVAVCGTILSWAASAFGVSTGARSSASSASGNRERRSVPASAPLPFARLRPRAGPAHAAPGARFRRSGAGRRPARSPSYPSRRGDRRRRSAASAVHRGRRSRPPGRRSRPARTRWRTGACRTSRPKAASSACPGSAWSMMPLSIQAWAATAPASSGGRGALPSPRLAPNRRLGGDAGACASHQAASRPGSRWRAPSAVSVAAVAAALPNGCGPPPGRRRSRRASASASATPWSAAGRVSSGGSSQPRRPAGWAMRVRQRARAGAERGERRRGGQAGVAEGQIERVHPGMRVGEKPGGLGQREARAAARRGPRRPRSRRGRRAGPARRWHRPAP